ncbi:molybdopterin-guanine dinucleotide biosynthesis protein B [Methanocaldococcus fervens]|uniref:Molybdopterin-guanine dinucleotide biosynthesis protein B n=1 Tax=Methanocaldococcus fervens (strain DSM 4213 / JCM 15782 / AG86) TaxID=573064 RepID=C7P7F0_METFA|nr:molybdopterin-guanine dinucleotide biosynthesis protein B [Methanocaldococcus fervens]ACV24482.1 molybdopterin-guanine dinucleotide biosynthesis protein B [Methanocaldococcus fervens AG86]
MRVIGVIGYKDSGKTTLIEEILKHSDKKIAVIKHSKEDVEIDKEGTDSYRLSNAGANVTVLSTDNKTAFFTGRMDLENILAELSDYDVDFVIIEGFKEALKRLNIPKIVMLRNKEGNDLIDDHTAMVIEDYNYNIDDVLKIIYDKAVVPTMNLNCGHCGYNCKTFVKAVIKEEAKWDDCVLAKGVKIIVDGKIIPAGSFVSSIVGNTIKAMIGSLKGVNNPKTIKVEIDVSKLNK